MGREVRNKTDAGALSLREKVAEGGVRDPQDAKSLIRRFLSIANSV